MTYGELRNVITERFDNAVHAKSIASPEQEIDAWVEYQLASWAMGCFWLRFRVMPDDAVVDLRPDLLR